MNVEEALAGLLIKYEIKPVKPFHLEKKKATEGLVLLPGYEFIEQVTGDNEIPLLPWRLRRKFVELKKIVDDSVIEDACLYRFCCMGSKDKWTLASLFYRELDLFEFIGNSRVTAVNTIMADNEAGSAIATLESGVICSIEVSTQVPPGTVMVDRHEIIASRGVASDQPVDTQVPMSSIYCYTKNGENRFTDTDFELFDLDDLQIDQVRSAFQVLKNPDLGKQWHKQHTHLMQLVQAVFESDKKHEKIKI